MSEHDDRVTFGVRMKDYLAVRVLAVMPLVGNRARLVVGRSQAGLQALRSALV